MKRLLLLVLLVCSCVSAPDQTDQSLIGLVQLNQAGRIQEEESIRVRALLGSDNHHGWLLLDDETRCIGFLAAFESPIAYQKWAELEAMDAARVGTFVRAEFVGRFVRLEGRNRFIFSIDDYSNATLAEESFGATRRYPCASEGAD
ncbi:MAG: hypothetical protein ACJA0Y_002566 [Maricaulis maris]|jgi:hypothetical protein